MWLDWRKPLHRQNRRHTIRPTGRDGGNQHDLRTAIVEPSEIIRITLGVSLGMVRAVEIISKNISYHDQNIKRRRLFSLPAVAKGERRALRRFVSAASGACSWPSLTRIIVQQGLPLLLSALNRSTEIGGLQRTDDHQFSF